MKRVSILGVPLASTTFQEAQEYILSLLREPISHFIATPNPEMLIEAQKNPAFLEILQKSALNLPDGAGLLWASRRINEPLPERITGTDMFEALCMHPQIPPVFLLGAAPGIAESAARVLVERNPHLRIAGTFSGSADPFEEQSIISRINASGAQILFVAFGAPKQELWLARNLSKMPSIRVGMGIGGAFDFLAGKQKRAPQWMRSAALEWLYRLIREPRRIGRIWNAVVVFPWLIVTRKNIKNG